MKISREQRIMQSVAAFFDSKRGKYIFFMVVLLTQVILIAFWAGKRSNYYIDELFSFGYAHSFTFAKKDIKYIEHSDTWKYEEWVDNRALKDQLRVSEDESLLNQNPVDMIRMLIKGRNYHGILNILLSVFSSGEISRWPPIILNLILFALTQLVFYRIMKDLTGSAAVSILAIMMYGFSGMAISTVLYIRFYMLVTLFMLLLVRIHQHMWKAENLYRCEILTLLSMVLIYLAMKNSELVFIIGGTLVTAYAVGLLIKRQYQKALLYIVTVFPVSLIYAVTKTRFLDIIFHPDKYAQGSGAESWMTERLLSVNIERVVSVIFRYLGWISDLMFGSWYVLCCFLILIIILLEVRLLGNKPTTVKRTKKPDAGFIWIIAIVCLVYYIFSLLTALPAIRYFMFYFPLLTILLWKMLHELAGSIKYRREVLATCFILVCAGAMALQIIRPEKIDFIYPGDLPLIQAVHDSGIKDAVVIYTDDEDSNHSTYECINLLPDCAKLYPVNRNMHQINLEQCPEQILIWIHRRRSPEKYIADLLDNNYELTELGSTHASDVYVARRNA